MLDLPLWVQTAAALVAAVFAIAFLRSLAAYVLDVVSIHALKCDVADIKIRQLRQLRALQAGVHPGDVFGDDATLERALEAALSNELGVEDASADTGEPDRAGSTDGDTAATAGTIGSTENAPAQAA